MGLLKICPKGGTEYFVWRCYFCPRKDFDLFIYKFNTFRMLTTAAQGSCFIFANETWRHSTWRVQRKLYGMESDPSWRCRHHNLLPQPPALDAIMVRAAVVAGCGFDLVNKHYEGRRKIHPPVTEGWDTIAFCLPVPEDKQVFLWKYAWA